MSRYLLKTVETYRVANDDEAKRLIEEAKNDSSYTLAKYSSEQKCTKQKGEIIDEWVRVSLTKEFCSEKEPDVTASVHYEVDNGCFPEPITSTTTEENEEEMPW